MKRLSVILTVALTIALTLTLAAACGNNADDIATPSPQPSPSPSAAATPSPTPSTTQVEYITIKEEQYSTSLIELDLFWLELTDSDIEPLAHMTNLTSLDLSYNQISDISPLHGLSNLQNLYLYMYNSEIDEAQITELQAALPDCYIEW